MNRWAIFYRPSDWAHVISTSSGGFMPPAARAEQAQAVPDYCGGRVAVNAAKPSRTCAGAERSAAVVTGLCRSPPLEW